MDFAAKQIAAPKSWIDFESLCHALFQAVWQDAAAQKNGRAGQAQLGVDFFGHNHAKDGALCGVQCKVKDQAYGGALSKKELNAELALADQFVPPLAHWIIVTTAPSDAAIQAYALALSAERQAKGLFPLTVLAWDAIQNLLAIHEDVARRFYPEQFGDDTDAAPGAGGNTNSCDVVDGYLLEIRAAYACDNTEYIEPDIDGLSPGKATEQLCERLVKGEQIQLIGPSGVGKTALLAQMVGVVAAAGLVPIIIAARMFADNLPPLLEAAISLGAQRGLDAFFRAAKHGGRRVLLMVDGLNECGPDRRAQLVRSLAAIGSCHGAQILLVSQKETQLPAPLQGTTLRMGRQAPAHRQRVVEAHLGRLLDDGEAKCIDIVSSAQDAVVLADVFRDACQVDGRYVLYATFIKRRLGDNPASINTLFALAKLARYMRDNFLYQMPASLARNRAQPADREARDENPLELALQQGLLAELGAVIRFTHDLVADFFATEYLLRQHPDATEFALALNRPLNAELLEFAVGASASFADVEMRLGGTPPHNLLRACLKGRCGPKAASFVSDRMKDALTRLGTKFGNVRLEPLKPKAPKEQPALMVRVAETGAQPCTTSEDDPYLALLPSAVAHGMLPAILGVVGDTDGHLERETARLRSETGVGWRMRAYMEVYGLPLNQNPREFNSLLNGFQHMHSFDFREHGDGTVEEIEQAIAKPDRYSPGQLFVLLAAFDAYSPHGRPPFAGFVEFMAMLWDTKIYHLRLMTIDAVARFARKATDTDRERLGKLAESWLSDNPFLNSCVFDALAATGNLELGIDVESVLEEFESVLQANQLEMKSERALSLCACMLDPCHPYNCLYFEVYDEHLSEQQRQQIHILALQSAKHDAMGTSWIIRQLAKAPTVEAAPVLRRLATIPIADTFMPQEAVQVFVNAISALAAIDITPELDEELCPPEDLAWLRVVPLIQLFWRAEQGVEISDQELASAWRRFEACGVAHALDVVHCLYNLIDEHARKLPTFFANRCPDGLRRLCVTALSSGYSTTAVVSRGFAAKNALDAAHREFAMQVLATVGRGNDIRALTQWIDDPLHGTAALVAARNIEGRDAPQ